MSRLVTSGPGVRVLSAINSVISGRRQIQQLCLCRTMGVGDIGGHFQQSLGEEASQDVLVKHIVRLNKVIFKCRAPLSNMALVSYSQ